MQSFTLQANIFEETGMANSYPVTGSSLTYNPTKRALVDKRSKITIHQGKGELYTLTTPPLTGYFNSQSSSEFIHLKKIATSVQTKMQLPSLSDYIDLSDLHDIEQTEIEAYEASKKFIW